MKLFELNLSQYWVLHVATMYCIAIQVVLFAAGHKSGWNICMYTV
jgi:hypothetical protein